MTLQEIGRYRVEGMLGEGGMATVYRAYDPQFSRRVAIKMLASQFANDPQLRRRFVREAQTVAALEHPAIVPVYDYGEQAGQPYLVMRILSGGSLIDRLELGTLTLAGAARILERLAPALDFAHGQGVIHRDLKPGNILFDHNGLPYLSDFGIVKVMQGESLDLTGVGLVVGTPLYMSPEQASGSERIDGRSDIYSLGVILYEMLTGKVPFEAETPMATAMKHMLEPPPDILQVRPDLPGGMREVIYRVLAKSPNKRYQTATALVEDLQAAMAGKALATPPVPMPAAAQAPTEPLDKTMIPPIPVSAATTAQPAAISSDPTGGENRRWLIPALLALVLGCLALAVGGWAASTWLVDWASATPVVEIKPPPVQTLPAGGTVTATDTPTPQTVGEATITPLPEVTLPVIDDAEQLTDGPALEYQPMLSPDGRTLAYFSNESGSWQIYARDLATGSTQNLIDGDFEGHHPHFAPDGSRLVFTSNRGGNYDIYTMNLDGSGWQQLTENPGSDTYPSFSKMGDQIVFMSRRGNDWGVYIMDADGNNQRAVMDTPAVETFPAFHPDGKRIVFQSNQDGNHEIYIVDLNGSNLIRLTNHGARDANPFVSPDGEWIVFESDRDGNYEIYAMRTDGSDLRNLTNHPGNDQIPSISPDGRWLLFQSNRSGSVDLYRIPFAPEGR